MIDVVKNILLNFTSAALSVYSFYLFFSSAAYRRFSKLATLAFTICISVIFTVVLLTVENRVLNMVLLMSLMLGLSFLFKMKWYNHIITTLLVLAITVIAEIIVAGLMSLVFSIDLETGRKGGYYVLGLFISKFLAYVIIMIIRFKKHHLLSGKLRKGTIFIILIPLSTLSIMLLQYSYFMKIPDGDDGLTLASVICYTVLIVSNILVFDLIDNIYNDSVKDIKIEIANDMLRKQEEKYSQLLNYQSDLMRIRHDQKNYLLGIINLLEEKKYDEALMSLTNEYDAVNREALLRDRQSGIIHLIETEKKAEAEEKGIAFKSEYKNIDNLKADPVDLAIVLGNAIDNAIEAASRVNTRDRYVDLFIAGENDSLIINIKNPTVEKVDTMAMSTTKSDPTMHGFGIISIKNIVDKYNGQVAFDCNDYLFQTVIILN